MNHNWKQFALVVLQLYLYPLELALVELQLRLHPPEPALVGLQLGLHLMQLRPKFALLKLQLHLHPRQVKLCRILVRTTEDKVQDVMGPPSKKLSPGTKRKPARKPSNPPKGEKLLDAPKASTFKPERGTALASKATNLRNIKRKL